MNPFASAGDTFKQADGHADRTDNDPSAPSRLKVWVMGCAIVEVCHCFKQCPRWFSFRLFTAQEQWHTHKTTPDAAQATGTTGLRRENETMTSRGGVIADKLLARRRAESRHAIRKPCVSARAAGFSPRDQPTPSTLSIQSAGEPVRWFAVAVAVVVVAMCLALLPHRTTIPPLVESDYCYLLTAADRLYEGLGLTATQPVAPLQPWDWQYDWGFLTQWPIGYPLLIWMVRATSGLTSVQACQWISVAACALAVVGWFVWVRRCVPSGVTGVLLAAVAAGCAAPLAFLMNPSTDIVLIALLPFVLLFTTRGIGCFTRDDAGGSRRRAFAWLACAGLSAGTLVWFRYAGVFVPAGIILYLLIGWPQQRADRLRGSAVFAICAAVPVAAILAINSIFSTTSSVQAQLNLGTTTGFDFSWSRLAGAWWNLTDLGFYDYYGFSHWVYALWPVGVAIAALCLRSVRQTMMSFLSTSVGGLSVCLIVALIALVVGATSVFGGKYDYVADMRYYLPAKPLYFVLFVAPLLLVSRRIVRVAIRVLMCVGLLTACSWIIQVNWQRPYARWLTANRPVTPYGQWSRCFEPGAPELYAWLGAQADPHLIVISNFHETIALETKIPALPIPKDVAALSRWIDAVSAARRITDPRVLFVLDPDNRWRDYWIPDPGETIARFALTPCAEAPKRIGAGVFEYDQALAVSNLVEDEFIQLDIQRRDSLPVGPVQRAGVDDAFAASPFIPDDVRVPVEEVIDVEVLDRPMKQALVAMENGDPLPTDLRDR